MTGKLTYNPAVMATLEVPELERILNRVHEWTRAADQKAYILSVLQTVAAGVVATNLRDWFSSSNLSDLRLPVILSALLWLASVVFCSLTVFARTGRAGEVQDSVTFFAHIGRHRKLLDYRHKVNTITDSLLRDDYIDQIWISGRICGLKHRFVKWGFSLFLASVAVFAVCLVIRAWRVW